MKTSKKLLSGKLFLVVGAGDFEHKQHRVNIQNFQTIEFLIVSEGKKSQNPDNWNPNDWLKNKMNNLC